MKISEKPHRPEISRDNSFRACTLLRQKLAYRLEQKGCGAWLSRHEILGIIAEEYDELIDAVREESLENIKQELLDIAVGCVFAVACIEQETLDW